MSDLASGDAATVGPRAGARGRAPSSCHVDSLDGLRGVAVLLVMLFHFAGSMSVLGVSFAVLQPFLRVGWAGVDVFFALSGFLITGILLDSKDRPGFFRSFYARRMLRIAPLYYLAMLAVLVLRQAIPGDAAWGQSEGLFAPASLLWPVFFGENVALSLQGPLQTGVLTHYWSLAVEEHFYLVWPLLVWACTPRQVAAAAAVAIAVSVASRGLLVWYGSDTVPLMGLTPLRLDGLAVGALAALALRSPIRPTRLLRLARSGAALAIGGLLAVVAARHTLWQFDPVLWTFGYTLVSTTTAGVILLAGTPGIVCRILSAGVLRWFGRYSFGLYVWHPILAVTLLHTRIALVSSGDGPGAVLPAVAIVVCATLGLAWLSFHVWERPFLRLKRFFPSGSDAASPAAPDLAAATRLWPAATAP